MLRQLVMLSLIGGPLAQAQSCGGSSGGGGVTPVPEEPPGAFLRVRADARTCPAPDCGGYYVRNANVAAAAETYVARLQFDGEALAASLDTVVAEAPADVILQGSLAVAPGAAYPHLEVATVYRGLPGAVPAAGVTLRRIFPTSITCPVDAIGTTKACDKYNAVAVNTAASQLLAYWEADALIATLFLDSTYLYDRILNGGAIIAMTTELADACCGNVVHRGAISQVYLQLPDTTALCPQVLPPACPAGEHPTFQRTPDRCIEFTECGPVGGYECFEAPTCAPGYTPVSYRPPSSGSCTVDLCDPSFLW